MSEIGRATPFDSLVAIVVSWCGVRPEPARLAALHAAISAERSRGRSIEALLEEALRGDLELLSGLASSLAVPETYFFRQASHFTFLARQVLPKLHGREHVRAWSAGCATGEEAYSLAACLLYELDGTAVEVLGTDLAPRHLAQAESASYGRWSRRRSAPILYPLGHEAGGRFLVDPRVRRAARFAAANLLDPPPDGEFDIVACRNVLYYLSPDAAALAIERIVDALAPGGVALFGPIDLPHPPPGLVRVGAPELAAYARPLGTVRPRSVRPPTIASFGPPSAPTSHAALLHAEALAAIERGERDHAERTLLELRFLAPDYLPGLFEHAMFLVRQGDRAGAGELMKLLAARLETVPDDPRYFGTSDSSREFYRVAARAFIDAERRAR